MPGGGSTIGVTMAATEGRDIPALAGLVPVQAGMAVSERADTGMVSGMVQDAILTHLEGADSPAIAGAFAAVATKAVSDGPDVPLIAGAFTGGILAAVEQHDTPALSGAFAAVATMARVEGPDLASLSELSAYAGRLAATEAADSGSAAGAVTSSATMAAREGRDSASGAAGSAIAGSVGPTDGPDVAAIFAEALAVPPGMRVREAPDVAEILGLVPGTGYHVYGSDGPDDPIDYGMPLAATALTTWTTGTLAPGSWSFGVRAFGASGEELNADCALTIVLDEYGNDITNRPAAPYGVRAVPLAAGGIRVEWWSPTVKGAAAPTGFRVYVGPDSPDYGSPAATVAASAGLRGVYWTDLSSPGTPGDYSVGVRAYNGYGEEPNTAAAPVTTTNAGPLSVSDLAGAAVV